MDYVEDYIFEGLHLLVAEDGENLRSRNSPVALLADGRFWVNNHAHVLRANRENDLRFLAYAVEHTDIAGYITGSAQPKLNQSALQQLPIAAPPLEEQRGIAATLGALDDKIDSNRRAIAILNQLSRMMFRDWRDGAASSGTSSFGEFAGVYGGATPKTKVPEFWGGDLAWATPTNVTGLSAPYLFRTSRTITQDGLDSCTAVMHPPGTILMTSRATIGAFAVNQVPTATNQGFIAVRPYDELHRWFLFEEMRSRVDEFVGNANGSTFLELSRGRFKTLPLNVPTPLALEALQDLIDPLHTKAARLQQEGHKLEALRDALLPELLSGRIRVPEAAEAVGSA